MNDTRQLTHDAYEMVEQFHAKFGVPIGEDAGWPTNGGQIDYDQINLRKRLIREEYDELLDAINGEDFIETMDALADMLYVLYGTAIQFGVDIRAIFEEVHRTNMAKVGGGTRRDGKILKPEGWQPPRIKELLKGQGWEE